MLIWANKKEVNTELVDPLTAMYKMVALPKAMERLKGLELSVIFRQIKESIGEKKELSILDFGAGASPFGAYLNQLGYQSVTCLDLEDGWHPEMDQEIYNKKFGACVRYEKADICEGHDREYDVIFSASVLEHIKDKKRIEIMGNLSRFLKPGGLFIHTVDYYNASHSNINVEKLINSCAMSITYQPEETPGCEEFRNPPEYAWMIGERTCIAFFNTPRNQQER